MTTFHEIVLQHIDLFHGYTPEESIAYTRLLIRNSAKAATKNNAVVWITENGGGFYGDDEPPLAAVIPATLAQELIDTGRLGPPPMASTTVVDWSSWRKKSDD